MTSASQRRAPGPRFTRGPRSKAAALRLHCAVLTLTACPPTCCARQSLDGLAVMPRRIPGALAPYAPLQREPLPCFLARDLPGLCQRWRFRRPLGRRRIAHVPAERGPGDTASVCYRGKVGRSTGALLPDAPTEGPPQARIPPSGP